MLLFMRVLLLLVRVLLFFVRVRFLLMRLLLLLMEMGLLLMTMRLLALGMPSLVRVGSLILILIRGNCLCTLLYLLLLPLHSLGIPKCLDSIGWTG